MQNFYGVRCDPTLPYDPAYQPAETGGTSKPGDQQPISRRNFIELCERLTEEDEKQFEDLFRTLGLSVDWRQSYRTIGAEAQVASQRAFSATSPAARPTRPTPRRSGTSPSARRSRRPSSRTASSRAPTTASRSTARAATT